jgi:hypothetical protein
MTSWGHDTVDYTDNCGPSNDFVDGLEHDYLA